MRVRTAVKAIIIEQGRILLPKFQDPAGTIYYGLPGGGQNNGETLPEALRRECLEEVNAEVKVGPICHVRDYIARNHQHASPGSEFHQLEVIFQCDLIQQNQLGPGVEPDTRQIGVEWLPIEELGQVRFFPQALVPHITGVADDRNIYLGDVD